MKATKWQRVVSLLLCLLMAMSFLTVTAPKAYAADDATAAEVTWPQITSFQLPDASYVYNDYDSDFITTAWKIKHIDIKNEPELVKREDRGYRPYAGEIQITVEAPVTVANGDATDTSATEIPTEVWVEEGTFSGNVTNGGTIATDNNLHLSQDAAAPGTYKSDNYQTEVTINYGDSQIVYYSLLMTVDAGSGDTNTAPALKAGVDSSATATTTVDTAWTLNLADIFEDADNDPLTYKVSVNGAAPVDADANYSYKPTKAGETTTLVFTANDGKADSPTYTVTLTATAAVEVTYAITATVDGAYIINVGNKTSPMGKTEITVNGTSASEAKEGDPVVVKAIPQKYRFANIDDLFDAKFDHWEVVAGPTGLLSNANLNKAELMFDMPAEAVSLKAVFVAVGSQVTLTANNFDAGDVALKIGDWQTVASTYDSTSRQHKYNTVTRTVIAGAKVSAYIDTAPTANAGFKLDSWEIKNVTKDEIVVPEYVASNHPAGGSSYMIPYFTVDGTSDYEIKAIFKAKDYGNVNVTVNDESMGTATAQIGTEEAAASINAVVEGTEVKLQAQPNPGYVFQSWSATYGSDNTQVEITNSTAAQTTFVMPATKHEAVNVVATFTEDPNYLSEACDLTYVTLLDNNDSSISYNGDMDGTDFTIEVPADTDNAKLANMILKLTYSENAQVFRDGSDTPWDANGQACNMTLGTRTKFVVRSQKDLAEGYEGPKQAYTITINRAKSTERAIESAKLGDVDGVIDQTEKTVTFTVPSDTTDSTLGEMILKFTCSPHAAVRLKDAATDWPAKGKACGMELDKAATFTVTAENGETQDYKVTITKGKSSAKEITNAILLAKAGDTTSLATVKIDNTKKTVDFTLPVGTDTSKLGDMILKLTVSEFATVTKENDPDKDWVAGAPCGMALDTQTKFTVTAEDGTPKDYTITIKKAAAPNAPTLSGGSATRSSKTAATVKFTTNEAGTYYYKVVTHGATAPTVEEIKKSTTKGTASAGETSFTLSNLTTDARDVYIVVVSAAGSESAPLKVEIPAYDSGSDTPSTGAYKISVTTPKGGTITTNRTKADAGDEIIVTVIPDDGYQMEADSLTYTLAKDKGETVKITGNKFTMPACDVTITCKWETATTTAKGITSFSINGVAGAVNNTTNTITITMPRGTDVTKLTPTISTNGVKSLTPGSGETVNFTNSVTYTATMEDGSTKTYTVTVYVEKGTLSDQFWDKLTDFVNQIPWWEYAKHQQSTSSYPKYW